MSAEVVLKGRPSRDAFPKEKSDKEAYLLRSLLYLLLYAGQIKGIEGLGKLLNIGEMSKSITDM